MVAFCVAFAELQTDMSDFTTDLGDGCIHFFDFKNYALRVLFPGVDSHDVMKERKVRYKVSLFTPTRCNNRPLWLCLHE